MRIPMGVVSVEFSLYGQELPLDLWEDRRLSGMGYLIAGVSTPAGLAPAGLFCRRVPTPRLTCLTLIARECRLAVIFLSGVAWPPGPSEWWDRRHRAPTSSCAGTAGLPVYFPSQGNSAPHHKARVPTRR